MICTEPSRKNGGVLKVSGTVGLGLEENKINLTKVGFQERKLCQANPQSIGHHS